MCIVVFNHSSSAEQYPGDLVSLCKKNSLSVSVCLRAPDSQGGYGRENYCIFYALVKLVVIQILSVVPGDQPAKG